MHNAQVGSTDQPIGADHIHLQILGPLRIWRGDDESARFGSGGGAGGVAIPLGAYAVKDGTLQFRPNTVALLSLLIPIIGVLGLSISMIIKALKRSR